MNTKQEQIASLQRGIASISIGNPDDEKIRLIAVIFWHLARFFVLLSVDELKKLVPLRIALALQHKLPFNTVVQPDSLSSIRTDGIVAEILLDLYGHGVTSATKEYSDVPPELRVAESDFAIITYTGKEEDLANWYLQGASNRELARFVELTAKGEVQLPEELQNCIVVGAKNHVVIEDGKPHTIKENKYVGRDFSTSEKVSPATLFQLVRIRDIE